jgi:hypothetical protein
MSKLWLTLVSAICCYAAMCQTPTNDDPSPSPERGNAPLFLRFTVNDRNGTAVLKWGASTVDAGDYFIVEKSMDGIHFEILSAIGTSSAGSDSSFSVTDNAVGYGMVYYRIRISGENGDIIYSKTLSTSVNVMGDFHFYPNPVDKLLIIRSSHPLTIQVMDAYGAIWFSQDVNAGMQIINVSTLHKGNYVLKATDKVTNTVISEQLIKN